MYFNLDLAYPAISLNIRHGFALHQSTTYTSSSATQLQTIPIGLKLPFGHMAVDLTTAAKSQDILLFIKYIAP